MAGTQYTFVARALPWLVRCRWSQVILCVTVITFVFITIHASMTPIREARKGDLVNIKQPDRNANNDRTLVRRIKPTDRPEHFLTVQVSGRLGNVMFQYASMIGIALRNGMTPVFPQKHYTRLIFQLSANPDDPHKILVWKKFMESRACAYEERVEHLPKENSIVELNGYYQSWKYFDKFKDEIRQEFAFTDRVLQTANVFVGESVTNTFGSSQLPQDAILVGIHIRLSDMADKYSYGRGYTTANSSDIAKAINYFTSRHDPKNILFVVCSDDIDWCKHFIRPEEANIVYSEGAMDAVDMAILTQCNHTIITVGSFGWWSAYLTKPGATVIYYRDFPRPNSTLWYEFKRDDYFYPTWIPMGN